MANNTVRSYDPKSPGKASTFKSAGPGAVYPTEPTVTASDAPNAAKLGPLGYVAHPSTDWTTGQSITVNGFAFNWTGTAWAAGVSTRQAETPEVSEVAEVVEVSEVVDYDDYPEDGTIVEVKAWVGDDLDRAAYAKEQEEAGQNRSSLLGWLDNLLDIA